jgi:ribosome-associated protein
MEEIGDTLRPGSGVVIPVGVVEWRFSTSGGPGGQHANRSNTRVEAALDLTTAPGIADDTRATLITKCGEVLTVAVDDTRSQHRNRQVALERLQEKMAAALRRPKRRRKTKPSRGAVQRRLKAKKVQADKKKARGRVTGDD